MIKIGDDSFEVPAPTALRSFALQQRILPIVGRAVGVLAHLLHLEKDAGLDGLLEKDVTAVLPQFLPALGDIFSTMPIGELDYITRQLLDGSTMNGVQLFGVNPAGAAFDALMRGRTLDTWRLLWYALGVWYPDFFGLAAGLRATARKASRSPASSGSPTSGPAGGSS